MGPLLFICDVSQVTVSGSAIALRSSITSLSLCLPTSHSSPGHTNEILHSLFNTSWWLPPSSENNPNSSVWLQYSLLKHWYDPTHSHFISDDTDMKGYLTPLRVHKCPNLIPAWGPLPCSFFPASCHLWLILHAISVLIWHVLIEALLVWSPDL